MAVAGRANELNESARPQRFAGLASSARNLTLLLADFLGFPESQNDNLPLHREPGPAVELDCLRNALAPSLLAAAERRSDDIGVGADQILIQWGVIGEDEYLDRLSVHSGLAIETFSGMTRDNCPLPDNKLHFAARHGFLPLRDGKEPVFVYSPRGYTARRVVRLLARYPSIRPRVRLTSAARFNEFLEYRSGTRIGACRSRWPPPRVFQICQPHQHRLRAAFSCR